MRRSLRTAAACLLLISLSSCLATPGEERPEMAPVPLIGGSDDLRRGPAPPATADEVALDIFDPDAREGMTGIRRQALREAGLTYGTQMGYARRSWEIEGVLERRSGQLSEVYDFVRIVSQAPAGTGYVVPPVVSRSLRAFEGDGRRASVADEYLTIVRPGRLSPTPPTWRDYLLISAPEPEAPPRSLLPSEDDEIAFFRQSFEEGWSAGVVQADAELEERLARLRRDYEGMLQYRRLVAQGMMDRIVLADADFGITGGANVLRIGDRAVSIVSDAAFQVDPQRWRVVPVFAEDRDIVREGGIPMREQLP